MSNYPSNNDMTSDEASWLFENGSLLVVLDMPAGSEAGMDLISGETKDKFKGVKMIPPGFHYFHYSAKNKEEKAPRTGIMKFFKPKEFLVTKWNSQTEELLEVPGDSEEVERLKSNRQELDTYLGPYPYDSLKKWVSLTNYITSECVERTRPLCGSIYSALCLQSESSNTQSRQKARMEKEASGYASTSADGLPDMKAVPGTELRFLEIPDRSLSSLAPSEVTEHAMDHSYRLKKLFESIDQLNKNDAILAELQMSFVCFLIGEVFEAFEQWKKLVGLLCHCVSALEESPDLFSKFIGILHFHIKEIPEDFFYDIVTQDNFLQGCLTNFFENIQVSECPETLKKKAINFKKNLEKKFNWNFDCETGDYAPVLVDLP